MAPDLSISYRHNLRTGEPHFLTQGMVTSVATEVREQLVGRTENVLPLELQDLTGIRSARVNGIDYGIEWSTDDPVTDHLGNPVLGICEFDPDGMPDAALICVNPEPVRFRREILLSTAAHEMGHGLFEAPGWIQSHQQADRPSMSDGPKRVCRTTTPDEGHFSASHPHGSKEFFQELRANEFMGSLLTPRRMLGRRFEELCEMAGLRYEDLRSCRSRTPPRSLPTRQGNLAFLKSDLRFQLREVLALLAYDFNVTPRFVQVRLRKYGLLPQDLIIQ